MIKITMHLPLVEKLEFWKEMLLQKAQHAAFKWWSLKGVENGYGDDYDRTYAGSS
jgi:hypothetical protein